MAEIFDLSASQEAERIQKASETRHRLQEQKRRPTAPTAVQDEPASPTRGDLGAVARATSGGQEIGHLLAVAKRSAISYIDQDEDWEIPGEALPGVEEEHVRQAFDEIDFDHNDFVGLSELRYLLTMLGEKPTNEELEEMIKMVDDDGKGQVSFEDFRSLFHPDSEVLAEMRDLGPPSELSELTDSSESEIVDEGMSKKNQDLMIVAGSAFLHRVRTREHSEAVSKSMPKVRQKGEGQLRARPKAGSFASNKGGPTATTTEKPSSPQKGRKTRTRGSVFHHNPAMFE